MHHGGAFVWWPRHRLVRINLLWLGNHSRGRRTSLHALCLMTGRRILQQSHALVSEGVDLHTNTQLGSNTTALLCRLVNLSTLVLGQSSILGKWPCLLRWVDQRHLPSLFSGWRVSLFSGNQGNEQRGGEITTQTSSRTALQAHASASNKVTDTADVPNEDLVLIPLTFLDNDKTLSKVKNHYNKDSFFKMIMDSPKTCWNFEGQDGCRKL